MTQGTDKGTTADEHTHEDGHEPPADASPAPDAPATDGSEPAETQELVADGTREVLDAASGAATTEDPAGDGPDDPAGDEPVADRETADESAADRDAPDESVQDDVAPVTAAAEPPAADAPAGSRAADDVAPAAAGPAVDAPAAAPTGPERTAEAPGDGAPTGRATEHAAPAARETPAEGVPASRAAEPDGEQPTGGAGGGAAAPGPQGGDDASAAGASSGSGGAAPTSADPEPRPAAEPSAGAERADGPSAPVEQGDVPPREPVGSTGAADAPVTGSSAPSAGTAAAAAGGSAAATAAGATSAVPDAGKPVVPGSTPVGPSEEPVGTGPRTSAPRPAVLGRPQAPPAPEPGRGASWPTWEDVAITTPAAAPTAGDAGTPDAGEAAGTAPSSPTTPAAPTAPAAPPAAAPAGGAPPAAPSTPPARSQRPGAPDPLTVGGLSALAQAALTSSLSGPAPSRSAEPSAPAGDRPPTPDRATGSAPAAAAPPAAAPTAAAPASAPPAPAASTSAPAPSGAAPSGPAAPAPAAAAPAAPPAAGSTPPAAPPAAGPTPPAAPPAARPTTPATPPTPAPADEDDSTRAIPVLAAAAAAAATDAPTSTSEPSPTTEPAAEPTGSGPAADGPAAAASAQVGPPAEGPAQAAAASGTDEAEDDSTRAVPLVLPAPASAPSPDSDPETPHAGDDGSPLAVFEPDDGRRRWPRVVAVVGGVVLLLGGLYVGASFALGDVVPRGATVAGVEIGGLSSAAAVDALEEGLADRTDVPVPVVAEDAQAEIDPVAAGLTFDPEATVETLTGVALGEPVRLWEHIVGVHDVTPVSEVDEEALDAALDALSESVRLAPVDGTVVFADGAAHMTDAVDGWELDLDAAATTVQDEWLSGERPLALPTVATEPEITQEETERALDEIAERLAAAPVTVQVGDQQATLDVATITANAAFVPQDGELVVQLDGEALGARVLEQLPDLLTAASDAHFEFQDGAPVIVPGVAGTSLDPEQLSSAVVAAATADDRAAQVELVEQDPAQTTEALEALGVKEIVSEFSTPLTSEPRRTQNIANGAANISGTLIKPDEIFSLTEALGPVDGSHGYVQAGAIINGEHTDAWGGGLSQVSTTTYNAAYFAGFEDVEHQPHSEWFQRYPEGREATIFTGVIDMRWRNNTPYGALVQAWVADGRVNVRIWGTKYWTVETEKSGRSSVVQPTTVYSQSATCSAQSAGNPGFTVTNTRRVYLDGELKDTSSSTWRYKPQNRVVCGSPPSATDDGAADG